MIKNAEKMIKKDFSQHILTTMHFWQAFRLANKP